MRYIRIEREGRNSADLHIDMEDDTSPVPNIAFNMALYPKISGIKTEKVPGLDWGTPNEEFKKVIDPINEFLATLPNETCYEFAMLVTEYVLGHRSVLSLCSYDTEAAMRCIKQNLELFSREVSDFLKRTDLVSKSIEFGRDRNEFESEIDTNIVGVSYISRLFLPVYGEIFNTWAHLSKGRGHTTRRLIYRHLAEFVAWDDERVRQVQRFSETATRSHMKDVHSKELPPSAVVEVTGTLFSRNFASIDLSAPSGSPQKFVRIVSRISAKSHPIHGSLEAMRPVTVVLSGTGAYRECDKAGRVLQGGRHFQLMEKPKDK